MIRTVITPKDTELHLSIPSDYVGKQVEVILYTTEEAEQKGSLVDRQLTLRGSLHLTTEQYGDFQQYQKSTRSEWERDI